MREARPLLRVVVVISGNGTNLQALIDACQHQDMAYALCAVISNRPQAGGLARARAAGILTEVVDHTAFSDRTAFDLALQQAIDRHAPGLVVLAGFMRVLTPSFVQHYVGRMLNIHPSLLPQYPGLNTHRRALADGVAEHGASVHFVTSQLDGGPVVAQGRVPVLADDTEQTLAARVHGIEHRIYPRVVQWYAEQRLQWRDGRAWLDGQALPAGGVELK